MVFGALLVFRTIPSKDRRFENEAIVYTSEALADPTRGVSLPQGGLILFALLCGGDYDLGIEKCGGATAFGLAKCGFGEELLEAVENIEGNKFDDFLVRWRIELQDELKSNSRGMLRSRQPQLAEQIPNNFPNREIIKLYIDPLTSWSAQAQSIPDASLWKPKEPSIVKLVEFCTTNLNWKASKLLREIFESILWEGVFFLQMLYSV